MTQTTDIKLNKVQLNALEDAIIATYEQGERAGVDNGSGFECRYRGVDDTKCLVGQMISDEDYEDSIDNEATSASEVLKLGFIKNFDSSQGRLLNLLQICHDEAEGVDFKGEFLGNLEREYNDNKLPVELGNVINKLREDYERENRDNG